MCRNENADMDGSRGVDGGVANLMLQISVNTCQFRYINIFIVFIYKKALTLSREVYRKGGLKWKENITNWYSTPNIDLRKKCYSLLNQLRLRK